MDPRVPEQPAQQLQRSVFVATLLDEEIQHLALVIDSAPQIHPPATDPNNDLVQMPSARRPRPTSTNIRRDQRPELDDPAPDRLTADLDAALRHQFLDAADAEGEAEIPAHRLHDDGRREHGEWGPCEDRSDSPPSRIRSGRAILFNVDRRGRARPRLKQRIPRQPGVREGLWACAGCVGRKSSSQSASIRLIRAARGDVRENRPVIGRKGDSR